MYNHDYSSTIKMHVNGIFLGSQFSPQPKCVTIFKLWENLNALFVTNTIFICIEVI